METNNSEPSQHYTFGHSDTAAQRLELLAQTFEPWTRHLLAIAAQKPVNQALDLGCGVGHTTQLVAQICSPVTTTGLDISEKFILMAKKRFPQYQFATHNVTQLSFPFINADLLHSRFLITHLAKPQDILTKWRNTCAPQARLLLCETSALKCDDPTFIDYYSLVEKMQNHYGQKLYIGQELASIARSAGWKVTYDQPVTLDIAASNMAQLHFMNLATWKSDPFAQSAFSAQQLHKLEESLRLVAQKERPCPPVQCTLCCVDSVAP